MSAGLDPAAAILRTPPLGGHPIRPNTPVLPYGAPSSRATFIDPTVRIVEGNRILIGQRSFVAPYATLDGAGGFLKVGSLSAILDNARIDAVSGPAPGAKATTGVVIGETVLIGQGATITGPSAIGSTGASARPTSIGANARIDGATIEPGAIVDPLARVGPGVTVPAGVRVLPGVDVRTDAEAADPALGKVVAIAPAELTALGRALADNAALAAGYTQLYQGNAATGVSPGVPITIAGVNNGDLAAVSGLNLAPGRRSPRFPSPRQGSVQVQLPAFRSRITGGANFGSNAGEVAHGLGRGVSIRADEGQPISFASSPRIADGVSIHAPTAGGLIVGRNLQVGQGAVILAGPLASAAATVSFGDDVAIGPGAVVERSSIGSGSTVGARAFVADSSLPPGTVVPDGTIYINNRVVGTVAW